jgi:hypothetical protein
MWRPPKLRARPAAARAVAADAARRRPEPLRAPRRPLAEHPPERPVLRLLVRPVEPLPERDAARAAAVAVVWEWMPG